eukprot:gi/632939402/ref/XP_007909918.1/ PREDICTED: uncharacterized protein C20orf195 homolog [Callorhinchus milii]
MMALPCEQSTLKKEIVRINECGILGDAWRNYIDRKNKILQFLGQNLNADLLRRYKTRFELLKKCSYYIDVLPKYLTLGDQSQLQPEVLYQLIDPGKFLRMKKIGTNQVKIQLLLLKEYLSELKCGREELKIITKISDVTMFLLHWNTTCARLGLLSNTLKNFISILIPSKLHVKHHLTSDAKSNKIPQLRLVLRTKMPVVFDRKESVASQNSVALKWFILGEPALHEQYELKYKLVESNCCSGKDRCGVVAVTSNNAEISDLLPDSSYEFTIARAENYAVVYSIWCDALILKTKAAVCPEYLDNEMC